MKIIGFLDKYDFFPKDIFREIKKPTLGWNELKYA